MAGVAVNMTQDGGRDRSTAFTLEQKSGNGEEGGFVLPMNEAFGAGSSVLRVIDDRKGKKGPRGMLPQEGPTQG